MNTIFSQKSLASFAVAPYIVKWNMTVTGSNRVNRGGAWNNDARNCRSAYRNRNDPGNRNDNIGFRLLSTRHL
ncbi:MAG: SUMF1/EgtB/PvdO family nonheme iron enzyme [Rhodobacteraceae bacterium]|nr:SUMF1/EgtB/PvdO family nonheme iron enzyme [Paracoccaceae bacterium]